MPIIDEKLKAALAKKVRDEFTKTYLKSSTSRLPRFVQELSAEMIYDLKEAAWHALGVDKRWHNEVTLRHGSPLRDEIEALLAEQARAALRDYLKGFDYTLTLKEQRALHKHVREEYIDALHSRATHFAEAQAHAITEEQIREMLGDLAGEGDK